MMPLHYMRSMLCNLVLLCSKQVTRRLQASVISRPGRATQQLEMYSMRNTHTCVYMYIDTDVCIYLDYGHVFVESLQSKHA